MINRADFGTPEGIRKTIAQLAAAGCHVGLPTILRKGVLTGRCGIGVLSSRDVAYPAADLALAHGPTVLIVADDDYAASGPLGWKCARRLARWPHAVFVHGAGAEEHHYLAAIEAAERVGRLLLVETSSTFAWAWGRFLAHPQMLMIAPPAGLPHPDPASTGPVH